VLSYTYSAGSVSWKTPRALLLRIRAAMFEERLLAPRRAGGAAPWARFSIWGAGRDGKAFFHALSPAARAQVECFCDVDARKVGNRYPQPAPARARAGKQRRRARARAAGSGAGAGAGEGAGAGKGEGDGAGAGAGARDSGRAGAKLARLEGAGAAGRGAAAEAPGARAQSAEAGAGDTDGRVGGAGGGGEGEGEGGGVDGDEGDDGAGGAAGEDVSVPIVAMSAARAPVVCCVSLETGGAEAVRANARRFFPGAEEGRDLIYFV